MFHFSQSMRVRLTVQVIKILSFWIYIYIYIYIYIWLLTVVGILTTITHELEFIHNFSACCVIPLLTKWPLYPFSAILILSVIRIQSSTSGFFNTWPAELFAVACRPFWTNNYKRNEIKSNFNDSHWPLSYTAVFWIVRSFLNLQRTLCIWYFTNI